MNGFSEEGIARYQELIESLAHIILQPAREGGFENAQVFKVGGYLVYFWLNESNPSEPVHMHIAEKTPVKAGTKE